MRVYFFGALLLTLIWDRAVAQQGCGSFDYQQAALRGAPALKANMDAVEQFIRQKLSAQETILQQRGEHLTLITVPVVVHILYNSTSDNITDQLVKNQIELLNQCFRRLNADSVNTPDRFKALAADCDIEFKLAITDPRKMATTGIVRKYTPVTKWEGDDKMKFSAEAGDDAWDPKNYLNIWVCNLNRLLGYSSFPDGPVEKDGVVLSFGGFRAKTIVHETGHWLGLRHIWGDDNCGDDFVYDTPRQSTFTGGCPSGIRLSCGSGAAGDMYMNYMDITSDACTNLFTEGQKLRMRILFEPGGSRYGILTSYALRKPLVSGTPIVDEMPKWFYANVYPNPTVAEITIDLSYDVRWIGKTVTISSVQGVPLMLVKLSSKIMKINVSNLKPGVYFITGKKEDGTTIKQKLIKM